MSSKQLNANTNAKADHSNGSSSLLYEAPGTLRATYDTLITALESNIASVLLGKAEKIRLVVCALLAGEHILIEDVPGVGKTLLGQALANSIDGEFKRIQFTPDLLPTDITGGMVYNSSNGEFTFQPGPVFANIVLADEINRTTPRTQSALLESMAENQVTCDRQTFPLPNPFMVIATQNPLEFEGAYPLPESQLDRFLMRISIGYPVRETEREILRMHHLPGLSASIRPVVNAQEICEIKKKVSDVHLDESLADYIIDIVDATRQNDQLRLGVSTRGALALYRAAQAWAFCDQRDYCIPDDIQTLVIPVLAHRLFPAGYLQENRRLFCEQLLEEILQNIKVPS